MTFLVYLSNGPVPERILDGGQLRFYGLLQVVRQIPDHRIVTAVQTGKFPVMSFPLIRFVILATHCLMARNLLVSYPNFPFYLRELRLRFGLSTLFLLLLALIKKLNGMRIIVDADDLPALEAITYPGTERRGPINKKHASLFEKHLFGIADLIWAIAPNEAEWIVKSYGVDYRKFLFVPNGNLKSRTKLVELPRDKVKFVYAGALFRETQRLKFLLQTFRNLKNSKLELYIMGYGGQWIAREYESPKIKYLGSLTHEEAERYVKACDVGVLLYSAKDKYLDVMSFPVKLALYITSEVPVLSLDSPAIGAFIENHQVGVVTPQDSLSKAIFEIADKVTLRSRLKSNCRRLKKDYYLDSVFARALKQSLTVFPATLKNGGGLSYLAPSWQSVSGP